VRAAFRTDSSLTIGTGHLYRCLTLADALRRRGASASFVCRELPGNLIPHVEGLDFPVLRLAPRNASGYPGSPERPALPGKGIAWEIDARDTIHEFAGAPRVDWLIVDHYGLDRRWEGEMRPFAERIMVIDDLADRPHDCDLLLDQNLHEFPDRRYEGLVPGHCRKIFGPRNALLRPEFIEAGKTSRGRDGVVRRILVFFGGTDRTNETSKALEALRRLGRQDIAVDVVAGGANPHRDQVRRLCLSMGNAGFHLQVGNMAELMAKADLAIGAPGTATWERCYLGLPAVTLVLAENQHSNAVQVSRAGATVNLGWHSEVDADRLAAAVGRLLDDPEKLKEMGSRGIELMGRDSFEGADGVAREMLGGGRAPA
jgi:UDP-2,4-diacetamido-2,4,6-trideoxy-beta-L-altropyranose hydrolase